MRAVELAEWMTDTAKVNEELGGWDPSKPKSNRLSQIGDTCLRHLVLLRTHGNECTPFPPHVRRRMERGKKAEEWAKKKLVELYGERITNFERTVELSRGNISGRIDSGMLLNVDDHRSPILPIEIKSTTMYDQLVTFDDFLNNRFARKWAYQEIGYELALNVEDGIIMLVEPVNYSYKFIAVPMDYTVGEDLLAKGESIERHLVSGTYPEQVDDPHQCMECDLRHVCCPDLSFESTLKRFEKSELEKDIRLFVQLKAERKEPNAQYNKMKKKVEASLKLLVEQNPKTKVLTIGGVNVGVKKTPKKEYMVNARTDIGFDYVL